MTEVVDCRQPLRPAPHAAAAALAAAAAAAVVIADALVQRGDELPKVAEDEEPHDAQGDSAREENCILVLLIHRPVFSYIYIFIKKYKIL